MGTQWTVSEWMDGWTDAGRMDGWIVFDDCGQETHEGAAEGLFKDERNSGCRKLAEDVRGREEEV